LRQVIFILLKKNTVFVAEKSVTNADPSIFHLVNHEYYLLYFNNGLGLGLELLKENQF
jgi:hypothetical protein